MHWRTWTKAWNQAKRPIKIFHATDCANFHGEFEGWDKERRDKFVANLLPIIPAHELAGIVIGIQLEDLEAALKAHPELIEMIGTPYTACFQWAISIVLEIATKYGHNQRLAFVHEINDYKGEVQNAFRWRPPPGATHGRISSSSRSSTTSGRTAATPETRSGSWAGGS